MPYVSSTLYMSKQLDPEWTDWINAAHSSVSRAWSNHPFTLSTAMLCLDLPVPGTVAFLKVFLPDVLFLLQCLCIWSSFFLEHSLPAQNILLTSPWDCSSIITSPKRFCDSFWLDQIPTVLICDAHHQCSFNSYGHDNVVNVHLPESSMRTDTAGKVSASDPSCIPLIH